MPMVAKDIFNNKTLDMMGCIKLCKMRGFGNYTIEVELPLISWMNRDIRTATGRSSQALHLMQGQRIISTERWNC